MNSLRRPWSAWINWTLALLFLAAFGWCLYISQRAAEYAVRTYGHNIDSGAIEFLIGIFFFLPAALLFTLAGTSFWRGWRVRWILQAVAIAWLFLAFVTW